MDDIDEQLTASLRPILVTLCVCIVLVLVAAVLVERWAKRAGRRWRAADVVLASGAVAAVEVLLVLAYLRLTGDDSGSWRDALMVAGLAVGCTIGIVERPV